ncbi:MAG: type II toxin-antitoxin system Phd/YefM family antitoxin [Clostridia bacterium]|nr:type II toxin-antitoxin system Phd/YefM family antitoxin [Clostridia bacterium]
MFIDTENMVSMTEANQNFSQVAKKVDKNGEVVIIKNNQPKYIIRKIGDSEPLKLTDNEKLEIIAKRILKDHKHAFEVLAE